MALNVVFCKGSPNEKGMPVLEIGDAEDVAVSGTAAASSACPSYCRIVRLVAEEKVRIGIGSTPTASSGLMMVANSPGYFAIAEGVTVSVIASS